ncbi:myosin-11-like isoform X2 [Mercenaria mercenaria]|uniref:myosin-11-like isoform X2 n=1 Tax=Mercenaria mercenaria TaxID=6596 RepID=UPI00234E69CC|nr:myosin-11-like isoform X2 [Mercenaria mercenaria]
MEGTAGSKGDATSSAAAAVFTSADKMRFCSLTYEIIEELKMRRELSAENEKKIEKLLNERFNMGWKLDQECHKIANLNERHEAELRETRRQLEEKMRDCQVDASQQQVYRKMAEKEKEALKDEIRRLQLANYSLEKKVRESERQEKIQANEREQHICQVSRFESQYCQVDVMIKQLTSKQDQLDKDMKLVQNLNKSLKYQNSHQKCILDMKEAELVEVHQQLLDTKVKVKVEPSQVQEREEDLQGEIRRLKNLVTKLEEDYCILDRDKDCWKEKYWDSLKKLDESHRLINVHLHNAARYRDESDNLEKLQKVTQGKLDETEHDLTQSREEIEQIRQKHREEIETFEAEISKLNAEKQDLNSKVQDLCTQKEGMEKSLEQADVNIGELEKQLGDVKAILNVEKLQKESQTDLQMLGMLHREAQATPYLQNQETQIEMQTGIGVTQTIDPALCSTEIQTDTAVTKVTEVQTELHLEDAETQTEVDIMEKDRFLPKEPAKQTYEDIDNAECTNSTEKNIIHTEKSLKNGWARVGCHTEQVEVVNEESEGLPTVQDNVLQYISDENNNSVKYKQVDSLDLSNTKDLEKGRNINYNTMEQNIVHKETVQVKRIDSENAVTQFANKAKIGTVKEDTMSRETNRRVDLEKVTGIDFSADKGHIGRFKFRNIDSNEDSETSTITIDRGMDGHERGYLAARLKVYQGETDGPDDKIKASGLSIPKIDIEKSIDLTGVVSVDPEEFSIELTQDEDSDHTSKETSTENYEQSNLMNIYPQNVRHSELLKSEGVETVLNAEKTEIEKSIKQQWEVSEEPVKITKAKAKKHKLMKELVSDQFSNFDISKEKFEKFLNKDEVYPKQPKMAESTVYRNRGLPKRQRSYSSMFQIEDEVKKVHKNDTEELNPKTNLAEQVCLTVTTEPSQSQYSSNVVNSVKKCEISIDSQYSNQSAIGQLGKQSSRQLKNKIMNQSFEVQSSSQTDNPSGSETPQETDNCLNNSATSTVHPVFFAKPLSDSAEMTDIKNQNNIPNMLMQFDTSSQQMKEAEDKACSYSTGFSVSIKAKNFEEHVQIETLSRNQASVDGSLVCGSPCRSCYSTLDKPYITASKPGSMDETCSVPKFRRPSASGVTEINQVTAENDIVQVSSAMSSSDSSTELSNVTAQTSNTPKVLNMPTKTESSTNFLQKYMDIVAKIKPVQQQSCQQFQPKASQKNTLHSMVSPGTISMPDFGRKVSPRGRTPKGILKGTSRNSRKSRNVTWNEYVLNKDYDKDENTPEDK